MKTHEQYIKEVALINSNIEVIEEYSGANTKILHRCKIDGYEWYAIPHNVLYGRGCPKCSNHIYRTHEDYVKELSEINPNIEVCQQYINTQTKILHRCKIDGYEWFVKPNGILQGTGCPKCSGSLKKTHEQYVVEVNNINPNIEVLEQYNGANTKILHKCKIDGHEWSVAPSSILHGYGCPECQKRAISKALSKSHDTYVNEVAIINPNIEVLEEYRSTDVAILHRCKIDGHEWKAQPGNILQGKGCPKCAGNIKRTHEEYVALVGKINPNIEVLGSYVNHMTPILHKCKNDGYTWLISPGHILKDKGCPICNQPHGEKQVKRWLLEHNFPFIAQYKFSDCRDQFPLPFDFYLPNINILIEYDGRQHFEPVDFAGKGNEWALEQLKITQYHDEIKNKYCQDNNIKLLRIPYFKNVEDELNNFLFI